MAISMYSGFVPVCLQLLGGLKGVLQKAEAHTAEQKWDPQVVLNLRLYPDMFTLERQVRQVCNHALGAGRVAGVDLPSLPDQDNSFAEIQARIDKTVAFLKGLNPGQLDGKEDAPVTVVFCALSLIPMISTSSPVWMAPRSILPVTTVPRPVIEKTSSTGIRNGLSMVRTGSGR